MPATLMEKLKQMDPVGTVLAMGAILSFILAMEHGQTKSWHSSMVVGLLVGFFLILITFCLWEVFQNERAMLPPRLLKQRSIWAGSAYQFFFAGSSFILFYYLPIFFQSVKNASPIASGVSTLPLFVSISASSIAAGVITTKTGHVSPLMIGGSAIGAIGAGLLYIVDQRSPASYWIGCQILSGIADGVAWQAAVVIAQANAKPEDISSSTAIIFCGCTPPININRS
jgi:predicted MFS family arabinose efflux permease